jgi:hypothetical protein
MGMRPWASLDGIFRGIPAERRMLDVKISVWPRKAFSLFRYSGLMSSMLAMNFPPAFRTTFRSACRSKLIQMSDPAMPRLLREKARGPTEPMV